MLSCPNAKIKILLTSVFGVSTILNNISMMTLILLMKLESKN